MRPEGEDVNTVYRFKLYVAGTAGRSAGGADSLRRLCAERFAPGEYDITVVDVLAALAEADAARILVTPTIVRTEPLPIVRVIGDLSATIKVAQALGLPAPRKQQ